MYIYYYACVRAGLQANINTNARSESLNPIIESLNPKIKSLNPKSESLNPMNH